jgi:hypothetical protein
VTGGREVGKIEIPKGARGIKTAAGKRKIPNDTPS